MSEDKVFDEIFVIWDDAQLLCLKNGVPQDQLVLIARRMWDTLATMNRTLEDVSKELPNVVGLTCVLNPKRHRIVEI